MRRILPIILVILTVAIMPLAAGCFGDDEEADTSTTDRPDASDRMALVAAQTILLNAQVLQDGYFSQHGRYAATTEELKSVNLKVSDKLVVVSGDASGYELQATAYDSQKTVLILRKNGDEITKVDINGKSW